MVQNHLRVVILVKNQGIKHLRLPMGGLVVVRGREGGAMPQRGRRLLASSLRVHALVANGKRIVGRHRYYVGKCLKLLPL